MASNKNNKLNPRRPYVWVITFITDKYMDRVEKEVALSGLDIQVFIPKIRVLDKEVKGKKQYVFKPLMFNYGFTKMPYRYACSKEKLAEVREQITAVYGFFRDPSVSLDIPRVIGRTDDGEPITEHRDIIGKYRVEEKLALVSGKEILRMLREAQSGSIFDADKSTLNVGDIITLSGPVYNGMVGEITSLKADVVKIKLDMFSFAKAMEVEIDYGNIFYTIYRDYNPNRLITGTSLDELEEREDRIIDKIYAKI